MTRLATLERVLVAARGVLEARDDQMLTQLEWDALAIAIRSADSDTLPASKPTVQIDFEDGLMIVMDGENQGYDCLDLDGCPLELADAQIDSWASQYAFDVEVAKRGLADYYPEL